MSRILFVLGLGVAILAIAVTFVPQVCTAGSATARPFIIISRENSIPPGLENAIAKAGGEMTGNLPDIGVAMATSPLPDFAARASAIPGIRSVVPDIEVDWTVSPVNLFSIPSLEMSIGSFEGFFPYQWGPKAIHAPEAWDLGARGVGVRVAIVDGGISSNHLEISGNLDVAASKSFVPGFPYNYDTGTFWHATHVAGIVAASANHIGTIGVAPGATLIGVKVLHNGSGPFSRINAGIIYAAKEAHAQIINLSLGASFPRSGFWSTTGGYWVSAHDISELIVSQQRALNYAYQMGATVIASAGNDAMDADHNKNLFVIPAQLEHVIAVSATGPVNFAGGGTNFDSPASYTNFGQSLIEFAAPGGDYRLYPTGLWYFDMVLSSSFASGNSSYYTWASGTSMAAPHVAGVAALIIEANGGPMPPAQVAAILRQSADDLGKPGNDDFYGKGRVNAYRAVLTARGNNALAKAARGTEQPTAMVEPTVLRLFPGYPNPFNPATVVSYQLPAVSDVRLVVYDLLGQELAVLVNERLPAGRYTARLDASGWASGTYICRLTAGNVTQTQKVLLVK
jgi:lantibiotic leader peptide-processing serine protease